MLPEGAKYYSQKDALKKWVPSILLLPICIFFINNYPSYTLIDNFHLIVHEAGHLVFMFFGNFIHALGGTLMQLIIPVLLGFYFFSAKMQYLLQSSIVLLGHSFFNIAVYVSDARARRLPLLGNGKHDRYYLLGELGLRDSDIEIGIMFFAIGIIWFGVALFLPLFARD
ncbi:MAG TPA: hypothetical protein PK559_09425 [Ignavibacteriaceae bacterium]|mgnify:CR=1 FL=1|nr:hypothetical protein [Ignavibacteriaceae bacterium]